LSCPFGGADARTKWLAVLEASCGDDSGRSPDDALALPCKATIDPSNGSATSANFYFF
jgi:hypothetical protein